MHVDDMVIEIKEKGEPSGSLFFSPNHFHHISPKDFRILEK